MVIDIASLLILGYKLALLTFSLGTLIYALPVPWRGVKIWGPRLIWDSIAATILISTYYVLLTISNKIPLLFGGSWSYFISWLKSLIFFTLSLKELVILAYTAARALGPLKALTSLLWPIDRLSNILWIFIATIYGLSSFVRSYYYLLIGLGIVLYSMPFRLGRNVGAWFIAFAIVFNAGLPLLPVFISGFYTGQGGSVSPIINYGLVYTQVNITDLSHMPINYGIVNFYIIKESKRVLVASYIVSQDGLLESNFSGSYVPLPSETPLYAYLDLNSVYIPLSPYPLTTADLKVKGNSYAISLVAKNIIWHKGDLILLTNSTNINVLSYNVNSVEVNINDNNSYYLEISAPKKCHYNINITGSIERVKKGSWVWLGVQGSFEKIEIKGKSHVFLTTDSSCQVAPEYPKTYDYYVNFLGNGIFLDINFIRSVILLYLTLPLLYLFMLFSISYALARLIGGRERIIPRFI